MRLPLIAVVLLAGCGGAPDPAAPGAQPAHEGQGGNAPRRMAGAAPQDEVSAWDLQSSGEGVALVMADASGGAELRLVCPVGTGRWLVNAPGFQPIGSEERLSFGHASNVAALVADTAGDAARGGVTGEGPVPADLLRLLSAPVSASYGAQVSGPHAPPPPARVAAFVAACLVGAPAPRESTPASAADAAGAAVRPAGNPATPVPVGACRMQGGRAIAANALRAVGTEPFWGARVEGRCVTYSHPDDPTGTRVWTTFSGTASAGTWSGALRGQPFAMRTRSTPCSDGMSDTRYPIAVSLTVDGEERSGCATPL